MNEGNDNDQGNTRKALLPRDARGPRAPNSLVPERAQQRWHGCWVTGATRLIDVASSLGRTWSRTVPHMPLTRHSQGAREGVDQGRTRLGDIATAPASRSLTSTLGWCHVGLFDYNISSQTKWKEGTGDLNVSRQECWEIHSQRLLTIISHQQFFFINSEITFKIFIQRSPEYLVFRIWVT